jgi:hypothetical protein
MLASAGLTVSRAKAKEPEQPSQVNVSLVIVKSKKRFIYSLSDEAFPSNSVL